MPRISTFMYADRAEPNQNGQMNITNPLLVISPLFVPGMFSFAVIFGVTGIDNTVDHTFQIKFFSSVGTDEQILDTGIIPLPKGSIPNDKDLNLPADQKGMMFNMDFRNVVFKKEGIHKSLVYIDGVLQGEFPVYVKAGEINANN